MKVSPLCHLVLYASLVCFLPTPAFSQDKPAPAVAVAAKPAPFTLEIRKGFIIEEGKPTSPATVGDIFDYLKKKNAFFSLALAPGVAQFGPVGDMILRLPEFNIQSICEAISNSTDGAVNAGGSSPSSWTLALRQTQSREVAVFNLSGYLNPDGKAGDKAIQEKLASVTDIIFKTLSDLDPAFSDATQPHYQFHKGANLLVVTGSPQAMQVAGQVVRALTSPAPGAWARAAQGGYIPADASDLDPATAAAYAWLNTIPAKPDATRTYSEMQNLLDALAAQKKNPSLPPEQLRQIQQQMDDIAKRLRDRDLNSKASAVPPVAPPPPTFR